MNILLTGGAGYIGSHTIIELNKAGHSVVVVDNLVNSNPESLRRVAKIIGKEIPFYGAVEPSPLSPTYVPGPDGKFGYGGKCFPKDVNASANMTEGTPLGTLLEHLHELNVHFRGVEEHI